MLWLHLQDGLYWPQAPASASLHCHFQSMEPWDGPETQGKQRLQKHSPKVLKSLKSLWMKHGCFAPDLHAYVCGAACGCQVESPVVSKHHRPNWQQQSLFVKDVYNTLGWCLFDCFFGGRGTAGWTKPLHSVTHIFMHIHKVPVHSITHPCSPAATIVTDNK